MPSRLRSQPVVRAGAAARGATIRRKTARGRMVVALVGGAVLGLPGAMIAVPVVGAVKAVAGRVATNAAI